MIREGIRALLDHTVDFTVCAEVDAPGAAVESFRQERPDVTCLDLMLGSADGFELIRSIRSIEAAARILVLSVRDEVAFAERCLEAGALGYAMKSESNETLLAALRRVANGDVHLSPRVAMGFFNRERPPMGGRTGVSALSDRELQVFQLIGLGLSSRQIAERLGLGVKTIETYRENIKNKLGLQHSTALVRQAMMWIQQTT